MVLLPGVPNHAIPHHALARPNPCTKSFACSPLISVHEPPQLEPEGNHANFIGTDLEVSLQLFRLEWTDRDDTGGDPRQCTFERDIQSGLQATEVSAKYVPMVGVYPHRHTSQPGREAPQHARLGGVRVHDGRTVPDTQAPQMPQRADVTQHSDVTTESGNSLRCDPVLRRQPGHVAFIRTRSANDEKRWVPLARACSQQDRIPCRTADVQSSDRAQHTDLHRSEERR